MKKKICIMVFGVFDRLHPGHRAFLAAARAHGDELIVAVARDSIVRALKNKIPRETEGERMQKVAEVAHVSKVILGDSDLGSYEILRAHNPHVICVGYDQDGLHKDLQERMAKGELPTLPIVRLHPHEPERFHTSLLREQHNIDFFVKNG